MTSKTSSLLHAKAARSLLQSHEPVIVYDVETSGLSEKTNYIIQFAGLLFAWDPVSGSYVQADSINVYIRQYLPIPAQIEELTGITNDFLLTQRFEEDVFPEIYDFLCKGRIFAGYNNSFDDRFISAMSIRQVGKRFTPAKRIDAYVIAKELIRKSDLTDGSYKLCNVAEYYKVTQEGFHNAFVDIANTWSVILSEMDDLNSRPEDPEGISDFKITSVNRWKKSYSRNQRYDRFYINTTKGTVVYDLVNNEIAPKEKNGPMVNADELILQLESIARQAGCRNYMELEKY